MSCHRAESNAFQRLLNSINSFCGHQAHQMPFVWQANVSVIYAGVSFCALCRWASQWRGLMAPKSCLIYGWASPLESRIASLPTSCCSRLLACQWNWQSLWSITLYLTIVVVPFIPGLQQHGSVHFPHGVFVCSFLKTLVDDMNPRRFAIYLY